MAIDKVLNKNLDDEFEVDGLWWLPNYEDKKVPGTLFFKKNEIKLELMGGFSEKKGFRELFEESNFPIEIVHGQSGYGESFTLIEAESSFNDGISSPTGYTSEVYRIDSFIVGGFFESKKNISFYSCNIFPIYLTAWLNKSPISFDILQSSTDSSLEKATANFSKIPTFKYNVVSMEAEVEEIYTFNFNLDNHRENLHWQFLSGLSIVAENRHIDWFKNKNNELKNFLSILIGEGVYFKRIYFKGDYEETNSLIGERKPRRKRYSYFLTQHDYKNKEKFTNRDILISFKEIESQFPILLNNWFEKNVELKEIYKLYFGIVYSDVVYLESSLLHTIQILEIYHRNRYDGQIFDDELFSSERKKIKGLLKRNLDKAVHIKMMESIGHANGYSLRMRLTELISSFSDNTISALIGDPEDVKKFIKQLVDTRNYLAHYDPDRKPNLLTTMDEQFYGIQRLKAIVTMLLFIELGIDEDFVINKVKDSKQFSYSLAKAKDFLND